MEAALVQGCTLTRAKSIPSSNRCQNSTSLNDRIAEFIVDHFPDEGSPVELLCVDHIGTYVVPYPCRRVEDAWRNVETNEVIEADVAGWRQRRGQARQACKLTLDGLVEHALSSRKSPCAIPYSLSCSNGHDRRPGRKTHRGLDEG